MEAESGAQNEEARIDESTQTSLNELEDDVPDFDENDPSFRDFQNLVDFSAVSKHQKWIILLRTQGLSYRQICDNWKSHVGSLLSKEALINCIHRFAKSLYWEKGTKGGSDGYLCKQDMETLKIDVKEKAHISQAMDCNSIREEALVLKNKRKEKTIQCLLQLRCDKQAKEERKCDYTLPHRTWVNHILSELDAELEFPLLLDGSRFLASTRAYVSSFYDKFGRIIADCPPCLLFTMDETMLDTSFIRKIIKPRDMRSYVGSEFPDMPHITACCATNVIGHRMPLFLILKQRKTFPRELEVLSQGPMFSLASTKSGWQDRWSFLLWTLCFLGWYTSYIDTLPRSLASKSGVLIMDGHSSRECPIALELFAAFNIRVLILPGHVTHILQMFDVGLAGPLKQKYGELLRMYLKSRHGYRDTVYPAEMLRRQCVEAIIEAWDSVASPRNCRAAAEAVGLYPFSPTKPLENEFVRDLTPEEEQLESARQERLRTRITINNKELTLSNEIENVKQKVNSGRDKELCKSLSDFSSFKEICRHYISAAKERDVIPLTVFPPIRETTFFDLM